LLVPSRSYATAGGVRYYELLRSSVDGAATARGAARTRRAKLAVRRFKDLRPRREYRKIAALPDEPPAPAERGSGKRPPSGKLPSGGHSRLVGVSPGPLRRSVPHRGRPAPLAFPNKTG